MTTIQDIIKPANVAVVTGGASGIGLAAARRFHSDGAAVVIAALAAAAKHEDDHHDNHSGYRGRDVVTCESRGQDHTYCSLGSARHVELKRQLSRASCQYNRSWGYDRHGIWVGNGCRAEFWVN